MQHMCEHFTQHICHQNEKQRQKRIALSQTPLITNVTMQVALTKIVMLAMLLFDEQDKKLFEHYYFAFAERICVYTSKDYADILEFFVKRWKVREITGLSLEERKA